MIATTSETWRRGKIVAFYTAFLSILPTYIYSLVSKNIGKQDEIIIFLSRLNVFQIIALMPISCAMYPTPVLFFSLF